MKKVFLMLFAIVCTLSVFAVNIPEKVKNAFEAKFSGANNIKWEKENKAEYEASFKLNGINMSANFDADGKWLETEKEIASAALPENVKVLLMATYPNAEIKSVEQIDTYNNNTKYEIALKTGLFPKEVIISEKGEILK